jgi:hypothetical protein
VETPVSSLIRVSTSKKELQKRARHFSWSAVRI